MDEDALMMEAGRDLRPRRPTDVSWRKLDMVDEDELNDRRPADILDLDFFESMVVQIAETKIPRKRRR